MDLYLFFDIYFKNTQNCITEIKFIYKSGKSIKVLITNQVSKLFSGLFIRYRITILLREKNIFKERVTVYTRESIEI